MMITTIFALAAAVVVAAIYFADPAAASRDVFTRTAVTGKFAVSPKAALAEVQPTVTDVS